MDYSLTSEQRDLRDAVRELVADRLPSDRVLAVMGESGNDRETWDLLADDMGLAGLLLPESVGGAAATHVESGLVLRELGAAVAPLPFLSHTVTAGVLARALPDAPEHCSVAEALTTAAERITAGATTGVGLDASVRAETTGAECRLDGVVEHVIDGPGADLFLLVSCEPTTETYLVDADQPGVRVEPRMTLDQTRRQARLDLTGAVATPVRAVDQPIGGWAGDLLRIALAAESVGATRALLALTVEYLTVREQFGRPIGSFQALQHRCADLAVAVEAAESAVVHAEWAASHDYGDVPVLAPIAAATAVEAFRDTAAEAIQLHGGIGFTWEHAAHLYFKRAKSTELILGGATRARRTAARRAGVLTG